MMGVAPPPSKRANFVKIIQFWEILSILGEFDPHIKITTENPDPYLIIQSIYTVLPYP